MVNLENVIGKLCPRDYQEVQGHPALSLVFLSLVFLQHSLYCTMLTDNRNYTGTYFSHMQNKSNKSCQMFLFHRRMKLMAVHQGSNLRFKEGLLNVSSHKNCPARYFSIPGLPKPLFGHIWSPSVLKCYINIRPV